MNRTFSSGCLAAEGQGFESPQLHRNCRSATRRLRRTMVREDERRLALSFAARRDLRCQRRVGQIIPHAGASSQKLPRYRTTIEQSALGWTASAQVSAVSARHPKTRPPDPGSPLGDSNPRRRRTVKGLQAPGRPSRPRRSENRGSPSALAPLRHPASVCPGGSHRHLGSGQSNVRGSSAALEGGAADVGTQIVDVTSQRPALSKRAARLRSSSASLSRVLRTSSRVSAARSALERARSRVLGVPS